MFSQIFGRYTKKAAQYTAGATITGIGAFSTYHLTTKLHSSLNRPAFAWVGASKTQSQAMTRTEEAIDKAGNNPFFTKQTFTTLDRFILKENIPSLIHGTGIELEDVRRKLSKYTDLELRDSLATGQSREWVSRAIQEIKYV